MKEQSQRSLDLPLDEIRVLCADLEVAELAIFGSAERGELRNESDVDFLVRFKPGAEQPWMAHFQALEEKLERLIGRRIDLVDREAVERSRNWIRRKSILESARVLYAA
jgi:uncharacterized protein